MKRIKLKYIFMGVIILVLIIIALATCGRKTKALTTNIMSGDYNNYTTQLSFTNLNAGKIWTFYIPNMYYAVNVNNMVGYNNSNFYQSMGAYNNFTIMAHYWAVYEGKTQMEIVVGKYLHISPLASVQHDADNIVGVMGLICYNIAGNGGYWVRLYWIPPNFTNIDDTPYSDVNIGSLIGNYSSYTLFSPASGGGQWSTIEGTQFYGHTITNQNNGRVVIAEDPNWVYPLDPSTNPPTNNFIDFYYSYFFTNYKNAYLSGYNSGGGGGGNITEFDRFWSLITGIFTGIGAIFSIELIPHVPIGIFFLIPLFFGVIGLILWIWRRN